MIRTADLDAIRNLEDVLSFFADALDWPIEADDLDDATFDYTPDELGVDGSSVRDLVSLRQLRPLVPNQPWGIFFLEFAGDRLPVVQVRRLLQRLVERKRRSSQDHKTWALNDLLFVVITGTGDSVELHLVAFSDEGGGAPRIKTLEWRPGDTPKRRLARLSSELLPRLEWPADDSATSDWQEQWQDAFRLRHGEAIRDAKRLAERMAAVAIEMRHEIETALAEEAGDGALSSLLDAYRTQLSGTATPRTFADTAAQTLVYGLLTHRIADPEGFGASPTLAAIPLANPFLAEFFDRVLAHIEASAAAEDSLEQLVADLRATNVEAVLDEFGGTLQGGDPVIHLYEDFLTAYDRRQRADSGAFYTPLPVVSFIVRAVHDALRNQFGLPLGIADGSTWGEVASRNGFDVPAGIDANSRFVQVVDPAAGTGTFLVEWIRQAHLAFKGARPEDDWGAHLAQVVLPSLHGFELNPAAYAIAHVKLALICHEHGVEAPSEMILLTDTLDQPGDQGELLADSDVVAMQRVLAERVKLHLVPTVILGNPPYDRETHDPDSSPGRRKGGVARYGAPGIEPLMEPAIEALRERGEGRHAKSLYNDYVYFWCWAMWKATTRPAHPGIVAMITASSFVEGASFAGLRQMMRDAGSEMWVVDLGGEGRAARTDENVFDIRTPVAIGLIIRSKPHEPDLARVHTVSLRGPRAEKFQALADLGLGGDAFEAINRPAPAPLTAAPTGTDDIQNWPRLDQLFPWSMSGVQVKRRWPIAPSPSTLRRRWHDLCTMPTSNEQRSALRETAARMIETTPAPMFETPGCDRLPAICELNGKSEPERIVRYGYRSFDRQWLIADKRVIDGPRPELWKSMSAEQLFLITLTSTNRGSGPALTSTPYVPDLDFFRGSYGARNALPLRGPGDPSDVNFNGAVLDAWSEKLGQPVTAESAVEYIYGLLGTSAYVAAFDEFLARWAGPAPVPLTCDAAHFERAQLLGRELLTVHSWGDGPYGHAFSQRLRVSCSEISRVSGIPDSFAYDGARRELVVGDGRFGPVQSAAWEFEVSGMGVLKSWLGYRLSIRRGRTSSPLDDVHDGDWAQAADLICLVSMVQQTIDEAETAAALLAEIVRSPVLTCNDVGLEPLR